MKSKIVFILIFLSAILCWSFLIPNIKADETLWNYFVGEPIEDIAISADGTSIILFDAKGNLTALDQLLNLNWNNQFPQSRYNVKNIGSVAISNDGSTIVTSCLQEHEYGNMAVRCFNQNGDILWSLTHYGDFDRSGIHSSVSVSQDGQLIALIGMMNYEKDFFLYDREGTQLWVEDRQSPTEIKISGDGNFILISDNSEPWQEYPYGQLHLFSKQETLLWSESQDEHYTSIAISYDGSIIAAGCEDNKIYVYNQTGTKIFDYSTLVGTELFVDVSADGSTIALGSNAEKVVLFNQNGAKLWEYTTSSPVRSVSLSADGSFLAVGCADGMVYHFSKNGSLLWSYKTGDSVEVSLSNDGQYLAMGSDDSNVYLIPVIIPEFSAWIILPLLMIATLSIVIHKKRIPKKVKALGV